MTDMGTIELVDRIHKIENYILNLKNEYDERLKTLEYKAGIKTDEVK